mmetsp:Transcript_4605/g.6538  ORF Transcript_4605/g.6538 Transcript_4605/m.6538 type:complete len:105 (+) Transcript_4605:596-910(+)
MIMIKEEIASMVSTKNEDGKWRIVAPEKDQLQELQSTINKLQDPNLNLVKTIKSKRYSSKRQGGGNRLKDKDCIPCKLKAPDEGESHTKEVNFKTYHWCKFHKL